MPPLGFQADQTPQSRGVFNPYTKGRQELDTEFLQKQMKNMMNESNFKPFLGRYNHKDGMYVVAFHEPDTGLVVLSENPNIKFFQYGNFDMSLFEPLGPTEVIRLSNYDQE